ncbi:alpha/beta hydrolase [Thalassospira sp. GB04J01]|uniref:alpha/beta fold hydrolase n=1 Tax=Thalassospira sp. GB04J01 TaxID=1485225 RepID=UPI000C9C8943|nr:alpha/beta hydrolase [Thalassospira sp. GB04J01]|tara:strand:+ start:63555 stop:64361 length:807 start_codon:yes stop_codon:yes gene_type:complete
MLNENFYVTVDGVSLSCQRIIPLDVMDDAPTIIFLHEALGTIRMWRDFPAKFATATKHPVIIYERRGHGRSDPHGDGDVPRPIDFHNVESDVYLHGLISQLGLTRPVLFGHSDGATIALKYAARFPDNVSAVISEAAHVFVEDVTIAGINDAASIYAMTDWKTKLERHHFFQTDMVFKSWVDTWRQPAFRDWNMVDELPNITCPLLVIQGDDDQFGSDDQVDTICKHVRGPVTKMLIKECGHIPHFDQPEKVITASLKHLGIKAPVTA